MDIYEPREPRKGRQPKPGNLDCTLCAEKNPDRRTAHYLSFSDPGEMRGHMLSHYGEAGAAYVASIVAWRSDLEGLYRHEIEDNPGLGLIEVIRLARAKQVKQYQQRKEK